MNKYLNIFLLILFPLMCIAEEWDELRFFPRKNKAETITAVWTFAGDSTIIYYGHIDTLITSIGTITILTVDSLDVNEITADTINVTRLVLPVSTGNILFGDGSTLINLATDDSLLIKSAGVTKIRIDNNAVYVDTNTFYDDNLSITDTLFLANDAWIFCRAGGDTVVYGVNNAEIFEVQAGKVKFNQDINIAEHLAIDAGDTLLFEGAGGNVAVFCRTGGDTLVFLVNNAEIFEARGNSARFAKSVVVNSGNSLTISNSATDTTSSERLPTGNIRNIVLGLIGSTRGWYLDSSGNWYFTDAGVDEVWKITNTWLGGPTGAPGFTSSASPHIRPNSGDTNTGFHHASDGYNDSLQVWVGGVLSAEFREGTGQGWTNNCYTYMNSDLEVTGRLKDSAIMSGEDAFAGYNVLYDTLDLGTTGEGATNDIFTITLENASGDSLRVPWVESRTDSLVIFGIANNHKSGQEYHWTRRVK